MAAATPTLEEVVSAIKTEMDAISSIGTVLTGFHGLEDEVEVIETGSYISAGSMNLWFIDCAGIEEVEGAGVGEIYERYAIEIVYWSLRTANADWSKEARQKAESVRDALAGNEAVFAIDGQHQILTPETVSLVSHGQHEVKGTDGPQLVYRTVLRLEVEARRWGVSISGGAAGGDDVLLIGPTAASDVLGVKVSGDGARRWNLNADGSMEWGDGTNAYDVSLARGASGRLDITGNLRITGLTASRLLATDGSKALASVANLASWVAGTANQVTVTDNLDGTITLSLPQNVATSSSPQFAGLTLTGSLAFSPDNTIDLTASNARPRTIYVGTGIVCGVPVSSDRVEFNIPDGDASFVVQNVAGVVVPLRLISAANGAVTDRGLALPFNVPSGSGSHREGARIVVANATTGNDSSYMAFHTESLTNSVTEKWRIVAAGHLIGGTDNTYDIGASGATRPRTVYAGTRVICQGETGLQGSEILFGQANTTGIGIRVVNTGTAASSHSYLDLSESVGVKSVTLYSLNDSYTTSGRYQASSCVLETLGGKTNGLNIHAAAGGVKIWTASTSAAKWTFENAGHLTCGTDNTYDIGASGATRPRTVYVGTSVNVVASAVLLDTNGVTMGDAKNIVLNTTTGTKIGTATTQKIGLWNATPVVQPSSTGETTGWTSGGGSAATSTDTYTGNDGTKAYTINDIVKHLKACGILAKS